MTIAHRSPRSCRRPPGVPARGGRRPGRYAIVPAGAVNLRRKFRGGPRRCKFVTWQSSLCPALRAAGPSPGTASSPPSPTPARWRSIPRTSGAGGSARPAVSGSCSAPTRRQRHCRRWQRALQLLQSGRAVGIALAHLGSALELCRSGRSLRPERRGRAARPPAQTPSGCDGCESSLSALAWWFSVRSWSRHSRALTLCLAHFGSLAAWA